MCVYVSVFQLHLCCSIVLRVCVCADSLRNACRQRAAYGTNTQVSRAFKQHNTLCVCVVCDFSLEAQNAATKVCLENTSAINWIARGKQTAPSSAVVVVATDSVSRVFGQLLSAECM